MMALLSGGTDPLVGLIVHWPILKPAYYLPPLPPFFASFLASLASFLAAPPFPLSLLAATAFAKLFAAYSLDYLSFWIASSNYFLNYSLSLSKIE